jgi:hypothetical protein
VRAKGCLMGIELVKDKATKEPFDEAGQAGLPEGLRQGAGLDPRRPHPAHEPADVMEDEVAAQGLDIIDEAIGETEKGAGLRMKTEIRFGVIGCGLMGREFASALPAGATCSTWISARDHRRLRHQPGPTLVREQLPSVRSRPPTTAPCWRPRGRRGLLRGAAQPARGDLHRDIICAGKHLMGEKPFGIDLPPTTPSWLHRAAPQVLRALLVRVPVLPGRTSGWRMIERRPPSADHRGQRRFLALRATWTHQADQLEAHGGQFNGEYGCMGDLGMHACHVPFRAGWVPRNVPPCCPTS